MKRVILILTILLLAAITAVAGEITGESITGEASQAPTNVSIFVMPAPPIIYIHSPENTTYYSTSILLNYSIKNNLSQAWYNLDNTENISLGNLTDNSLSFTTTLGFHTLYLYANNSLGNSSKSVSFTVSQAPPSSSSSTSSGGSGGGNGVITVPNFELDRELIELSMLHGEAARETILVTNTGDKALNITFELVDLEETAIIEEDFVFLMVGETKEVNINFFSLSKVLPGLYVGKIVFNAGAIQKQVHVLMEIKERQALFDVNLEILPQYKVISPGRKISVLIDMTNIGFKGTPVDVTLTLFLMDLDKNILHQTTSEMIAVKTNLSITRKLEIPASVADGKYIALAELRYNGFKATSYDTFDVIKRHFPFPSWWLLILVLIILIVVILLRIRKTHKKIEKTEKPKIRVKRIKKKK